MTTITAYAIINQLNDKLAELGIDKVLPNQMGYTYAKKGMINGTKNAKQFTQDEADTFIASYLTRNGYIQEASATVVPETDGTVGEW